MQNEPPSVVGNASCWALHMGMSSNLRYQMLNGLDMVGYETHSLAAVCCYSGKACQSCL